MVDTGRHFGKKNLNLCGGGGVAEWIFGGTNATSGGLTRLLLPFVHFACKSACLPFLLFVATLSLCVRVFCNRNKRTQKISQPSTSATATTFYRQWRRGVASRTAPNHKATSNGSGWFEPSRSGLVCRVGGERERNKCFSSAHNRRVATLNFDDNWPWITVANDDPCLLR